jgi:predicted phosphodiesterase
VRLALLADVHGNLEALRTVLRDLARSAPDARLVCAGDVVGYGPEPEACLEMLAEREAIVVRGNHEEMVLGMRDFERAGHAGIVAALWTRARLSSAARRHLEALPAHVDAGGGVVICHGDLSSADTYVATRTDAERAVAELERVAPRAHLLVCGHTHHPLLFTRGAGIITPHHGATLRLLRARPSVINPGSVGQERVTQRPWARYALLDVERGVVVYRALAYDHAATVRQARRMGLRPTIVLLPPRGLWRRVEGLRTRWARRRARLLARA